METEQIIETTVDVEKKKKRLRKWIIAGVSVLAVIATFFILLFSTQKETKLHVTGDPIKDSQIVLELFSSDPAQVKVYLGYVEHEYNDPDPAKKEKFMQLIEENVDSLVLTPSGNPVKDALVFTNVAFLMVHDEKRDICINKAMEFLNKVMSDPIYQNDTTKMGEFRRRLDFELYQEGMSLSDLGF